MKQWIFGSLIRPGEHLREQHIEVKLGPHTVNNPGEKRHNESGAFRRCRLTVMEIFACGHTLGGGNKEERDRHTGSQPPAQSVSPAKIRCQQRETEARLFPFMTEGDYLPLISSHQKPT